LSSIDLSSLALLWFVLACPALSCLVTPTVILPLTFTLTLTPNLTLALNLNL
jgi:hypothetical protein